MAYSARILADSVNVVGDRLTTFEITFPRIVLAEFNTHREFSRNSASSRAIPVKKQIERIKKDPFIPVHWGKNQSGMQAVGELEGWRRAAAKFLWLRLRDIAIAVVQLLVFLGLHKQIANRLLEPWMWHTVIVTSCRDGLENFFAQRCHKDAQPEIQVIAKKMLPLYRNGTPRLLQPGDWHAPLLFREDWAPDVLQGSPSFWQQVSAGRCARVSYLTHDGRRDHKEDVALYGRLTGNGHMSPLEHVAQALDESVRIGNFTGFKQLRKFLPGESIFDPNRPVSVISDNKSATTRP